MSTVDRISELPDDLLHHILSYLPIKDAARTSVLSKWWNNAWETLTCLNFNDERFVTLPDFSDGRCGAGDSGYLSEEVVSIIQRRQQQHIGIEKFSLFIPPSWGHKQHYNGKGILSLNSLRYVGTTSLKELELINGISGSRPVPLLPSSLLSAKRLTVLSLTRFDLSSCWSSLEINFTGLKKVALTFVDLDDGIMENLIMPSRSSLEALELKMCWGVKTIWLGGGFVKLKRLRVEMVSSMEVLEVSDAPEFVDLYVNSNNRRGYPFKFNVKSCPRLRKVLLHCASITENHLHQLLEYCLYLEELTIVNSYALSNINISSDSLKTLYLGLLRNLRKVDIFSHTLESLTFEVSSELEHVPTISLNGSDITVGAQVNLIRIRFGLAWNNNLIQFLKNFRHITLECHQVITMSKQWRDKLLSPFYVASDISFFMNPIRVKSMAVAEVVAYLLWLAPRAERVSIILPPTTTLLSLELVYRNNDDDHKEEKKNFYCSSCKLLPVDCWLHCLKEVRIQTSEYDLVMMKDFFLKRVKNLKIVEFDNGSGKLILENLKSSRINTRDLVNKSLLMIIIFSPFLLVFFTPSLFIC